MAESSARLGGVTAYDANSDRREYVPVAQNIPETVTVTDSSGAANVFARCEASTVKELLTDRGIRGHGDLEPYGWYLCEGDLTLDDAPTSDLVVTGDLTIRAPLAEPSTGLIVLGQTTVNAIYLPGDEEVFLVGGVRFSVALISIHSELQRELRDLAGPFAYNDGDSTNIEGVDGVQCYVDYVNTASHGDPAAVLLPTFLLTEDGDEIVDVDRMLGAIKMGERVLVNAPDAAVDVAVPDVEDRATVLSLLAKDGHYLRVLDDAMRADQELVAVAVERSPRAFEHAAVSLKHDRDFVKALLQTNGRLLEVVPEVFQDDRELVEVAMASRSDAFSDASASLRSDKEFALAAVIADPGNLEYVDESLQADEDLLLAVIGGDASKFKYASLEAVQNLRVMHELVVADPTYLEADPLEHLRADKEFIAEAAVRNPRVFEHIEESLQQDPAVLQAVAAALNVSVEQFLNDLDERTRNEAAILKQFRDHS